MSLRLGNLVEITQDPLVLLYVWGRLGRGVPIDACFTGAIVQIRQKALARLLGPSGPINAPRQPMPLLQQQLLQQRLLQQQFLQPRLLLQQRQQQMLEFQNGRVQRKQLELIEDRTADLLLEVQEKDLALLLFQQSSMGVFLNKLAEAPPPFLREQLKGNDVLARFLTVVAIGKRRLHLEQDLIELLDERYSAVRNAAHWSLMRVARGTDFGPMTGASKGGIGRSALKWKQWLALQQSAGRESLAKDTANASTKKQSSNAPLEIVRFVLAPDDRPTLSTDAAKLSDELVGAADDQQRSTLARLRDAKGVEYTDALALAIPKLSGNIKRQARDALAERLTRMTTATLRDKLQDDNIEVRCAAVLACGHKNARETIPDLLQLLDDPEMDVIQTARVVLTELTGKDFGPKSDAGRRGCAESADAWRKWWREHQDSQK